MSSTLVIVVLAVADVPALSVLQKVDVPYVPFAEPKPAVAPFESQ